MGSGGTNTVYQSDPQRQALMQQMMPIWNRLLGAGQGGQYQIGTQNQTMQGITGYSQPVYDQVSGAPMGGGGEPIYGPITSSMPIYAQSSGNAAQDLGVPMPTQGWLNNLAPSIKQGIWEPYGEAGQNMLNEIIGGGMAGSNRGGLSNSATQLLGDYYAKAGTQYGNQLWNMTYPQSMEAWRMPYNMAGAALGVTLPDTVVGSGGGSAQTAMGLAGLGLGAYQSGMFGGAGAAGAMNYGGLTAASLYPSAASTAGILGTGASMYGAEMAPLFLL